MFQDYRGKTFLALEDASFRRLLNDAMLYSRRVCVVSYPKSGRTWLRIMLHELGFDPRFSHVDAGYRKQNGPSDICKHIPRYCRRRIIFLIRDPLDVVVSLYHHALRRDTWRGSFGEFIRLGQQGFERILAFNLGWLEHRAQFRDFIVISYEAMRINPERSLRAVLNFTGASRAAEADIERVAVGNRFDAMKKREACGELRRRFGSRFSAGLTSGNQMVVRRGVVGGYRDEMTEEELEYCGELMWRYRYFPRIRSALSENDISSPV
jgi:hypothetical protein